ncbi:MAG: twin-arginine translocation signal domain-containing protein [Candidatus Bipolaricaulota bacterium]
MKSTSRRTFLQKTCLAGVAGVSLGCAPAQRGGRRTTKRWKTSGVVATLPPEKRVYRDEKTGREVWQMTRGKAPSLTCYMEAEALTEDERYTVFCSNRTGRFEVYRADVDSGEIAQLSDIPGLRGESPVAMERNGREAIYTDGWRIFATDVATGETRMVADLEKTIPNPIPEVPRSFSGSGDRCVITYEREDGNNSLGIVFMKTGEFHEVFRGNSDLAHPQLCPGDPNLITFVPLPDTQNDMNLPMEQRARSWICDTATGQARPFLIVPYGFRATHEYWDYRGDRLYFHKKSKPGWTPTTISSINRAGEDWQDHYESQDRKLGHSSIDRTGQFIVSDVQQRGDNELYRIDLKTGSSEILCWPNTSGDTHVHPSISARGRYAYFASNRTGVAHVYLCPLVRQ